MKKFHYTYRITNKEENKHYYGVRSCSTHPKEDLGVRYLSSSTDSEFISQQKHHPEKFKYKIILISDRAKCAALEVRLHKKFNVGASKEFYNKAIQTSSSFTTHGNTMRDRTLYEFHNKKTGEVKKCTYREMALFLNSNHIYSMKRGSCVKGWCILNKKRNVIPKNIEYILHECLFEFYDYESQKYVKSVPSEMMRVHNLKKYPMIHLIIGSTKKYKNLCLGDTARKEKKEENSHCDVKIKDTEFLFKTLDGGETFYGTIGGFSEKTGISKTFVYSLIKGKAKSAKGWCCGWYTPYKEKIEGNHTKYNNKDTSEYKVFDLTSGEGFSTTRDELLKKYKKSEATISMFLSEKTLLLDGVLCLFKNRDKITEKNKIKVSYTFLNIESGEKYKGTVPEFIKHSKTNKSAAYGIVKNKSKTTKTGWIVE